MPEGPEAKRIATQLSDALTGWKVELHSLGGRYSWPNEEPDGYGDFFDDFRRNGAPVVEKVDCRGKFVYWQLERDWSIWNTLGMSGSWEIFNTVDGVDTPKHAAVTLLLKKDEQQSIASFVDARHFGTVKFVKGREALQEKLQSMMFDFLDGPKSTTAIWHYLHDCKKSLLGKEVGVVLMDQNVFPGIGNYLRAEILYAARVSPWRKLRDVTYEQLTAICSNAHAIMKTSYETGGATIATYRNVDGKKGEFASRFAVYGRKTDALGNEVKREKTPDGRTIHWVPALQA